MKVFDMNCLSGVLRVTPKDKIRDRDIKEICGNRRRRKLPERMGLSILKQCGHMESKENGR